MSMRIAEDFITYPRFFVIESNSNENILQYHNISSFLFYRNIFESK